MLNQTYLVKLVEVGKNDRFIRKIWEDLFAHRPSALLLFLPVRLSTLRIWSTLSVVATEESIPAEYNVLSVYPILICAATVVVFDSILEIDIATPLTECIRRYSGIISKQIVAPFGAESTGEAHESHLNRGCAGCKYLVSSASGIAV